MSPAIHAMKVWGAKSPTRRKSSRTERSLTHNAVSSPRRTVKSAWVWLATMKPVAERCSLRMNERPSMNTTPFSLSLRLPYSSDVIGRMKVSIFSAAGVTRTTAGPSATNPPMAFATASSLIISPVLCWRSTVEFQGLVIIFDLFCRNQ
ncbi:hypothetical protein D3C77_517770 [compost metagenome]